MDDNQDNDSYFSDSVLERSSHDSETALDDIPPEPSTSSLDIVHEAQSLLDDNKAQMSDELYLKLSNINSKLFTQQDNNFYKITFIDGKVSKPSNDIYLYRPMFKTQVLTLTKEMFDIYTNLKEKGMREDGYYLPTSTNLLGLDLSRLNTNPLVDIYSSCCDTEMDCECESCETVCNAPELHTLSLDFEPIIVNILKL